MTAELSSRAEEVLESISRVVEASPGLEERAVGVRAGVRRRKNSEAALGWLLRHGFVERYRRAGEWRYQSVREYRAVAERPLRPATRRV